MTTPHATSSGFTFLPKSLGYLCLLLGFLGVVLSRGLETLSYQGSTQAAHELRISEIDFETEWNEKLAGKTGTERMKIVEEQTKERAEMEDDTWRDLRAERDKARIHAQGRSWWFSLLFVSSSMVLVSGLLIVGLQGVGPEKYLCLAMLLVITVSLYIGGTAWITSIIAAVEAVD